MTSRSKTIFADNGTICGPISSNKFIKIERNVQLVAARRNIIIAGQSKSITSVMVFKATWLNAYFLQPIARNKARIQTIYLCILSAHCEHCRGRPGHCGCSVCPRKSESSCSPSIGIGNSIQHLFAAFESVQMGNSPVQQNNVPAPAPARAPVLKPAPVQTQPPRSLHCGHCNGAHGKCSCAHACNKSATAECLPIHLGILCDACEISDFEGSRFKCSQCKNFDLCARCYNGGMHDPSHAFHHIAKQCVTPVLLEARKPPANQHDGVFCSWCSETPILGVRFKCSRCSDANFCAACYARGTHDGTHPFVRMEGGGGAKTLLPPRDTSEARAAPASPVRKPAAAASEFENYGKESGNIHPAEFRDDMCAAELKSFLSECGVAFENVGDVEHLRKLAWHTHCDSVSVHELTRCLQDLDVDVPCHLSIADRRKFAKEAWVRRQEREQHGTGGGASRDTMGGFEEGQRVALVGLNTTEMNGLCGRVACESNVGGRLIVVLD